MQHRTFNTAHSWDVTPEQAMQIQHQLRSQVQTTDDFGELKYVAGVDVAFEDEGNTTRAAIVTLNFPYLTVHEQILVRRPTTFPYIPGLLSFREIPTILAALEQLETLPDMLLVDGMGILHPRRLGIASHLGVITNLPSIGVGKSPFVGKHQPLADERGAWQPIVDRGQTIGAVLRSKVGVKPLYISSGHRVSLESALAIVMQCLTKYRLPETTRLADKLSKQKE